MNRHFDFKYKVPGLRRVLATSLFADAILVSMATCARERSGRFPICLFKVKLLLKIIYSGI